jgi:hypothetical protein
MMTFKENQYEAEYVLKADICRGGGGSGDYELNQYEIVYLMALILKEKDKFRGGGPSFLSLETVYEKLKIMLQKLRRK